MNKNFIFSSFNDDHYLFNNNNYSTNKRENIKDCEKIFVDKLNFLLNQVFDKFIEQKSENFLELDKHYFSSNIDLDEINNDKNDYNTFKFSKKGKQDNEKNDKRTLSDSIRETFNSAKNIVLDDNFTFKGIYIYHPKHSRLNEKYDDKIILELYYRKIIVYQGEIIEFYFNDVTTLLSKVEREKEQNKIKSLILAKDKRQR